MTGEMRLGLVASLAALLVGGSSSAALAAKAKPKSSKPAVTEKAEPKTPMDYLQLSKLALDSKHYAQAEKIAREGQEKFPEATAFHVMIAESWAGRSEFAKAFWEFQWELMRVGAERPSGQVAQKRSQELLQNARGTGMDDVRRVIQTLQDEEKDPAKAVDTLKRIRDEHDSFVLRLFYAEALVAAKRESEAEPIYRSLLEEDRCFIPAYVELAGILERQGKKAEADGLIAKARELDPDHWRLRAMTDGAPQPN